LKAHENAHAEMIGLDAITEVWRINSRVWSHIKIYIANWASRFKSSHIGRKKDDDIVEKENDLEKAVTYQILSFCKSNPSSCGHDLLPIIISLLKCSVVKEFGYIRDLSEVGTGNLLSAFNACVDADITSPKAGLNFF
jgi:hypothetical protein